MPLRLLRERRQQARARTVTLRAARERARRGAACLDAADPGWHTRLDPATLELADGARCVLGQLHGAFRLGLFRARIWDGTSAPGVRLLGAPSPVDLGFYARRDAGPAAEARDYDLLNRAWREEIEDREPAAGLAPDQVSSSRKSTWRTRSRESARPPREPARTPMDARNPASLR